MGHLHTRQSAARNVAYCGTPLKYSSSECSGKKCAVMVEIDGKDISTREIPLVPMRDMRIIKGTLRELTDTPQGNTDDYIFAVLTDEAEPIDSMGSLRSVYPNIMSLRFDNRRSKSNADIQLAKITNKTPVQLFAEFYEMQNNIELTKEQAGLVKSIFACMEEEQ
ncbi:MAG: exonuclease SbcCD subunit D C-terminal domain-containing protein [Acutalibacteraceae bacterium]